MDFNFNIGVDRGALVAAFAGAVAYLVTQDKMKPARAFGYVIVGGMAAAYIGPAIVEGLAEYYKWNVGEKTRGALIFMTGVSGIWIIHIIVAIMEALKANVGGAVGRWVEKMFGDNKPTGGQ